MSAASCACLELPADSSMRAIGQVADAVKALALAEGGDVALEGGHVRACDITLVQLLVSATATLARQGRGLALLNPSDSVETAFSRAGVAMPRPEPGVAAGAQ